MHYSNSRIVLNLLTSGSYITVEESQWGRGHIHILGTCLELLKRVDHFMITGANGVADQYILIIRKYGSLETDTFVKAFIH